MRSWVDYSLTEKQFAQLVGKCKMYQHLPSKMKRNITPMLFGDQQMGAVVRNNYKDERFCRDRNGNINLWRLYNLFTGVNKNSYMIHSSGGLLLLFPLRVNQMGNGRESELVFELMINPHLRNWVGEF